MVSQGVAGIRKGWKTRTVDVTVRRPVPVPLPVL